MYRNSLIAALAVLFLPIAAIANMIPPTTRTPASIPSGTAQSPQPTESAQPTETTPSSPEPTPVESTPAEPTPTTTPSTKPRSSTPTRRTTKKKRAKKATKVRKTTKVKRRRRAATRASVPSYLALGVLDNQSPTGK
jgi:outer membrane biosynthesis protein TonB